MVWDFRNAIYAFLLILGTALLSQYLVNQGLVPFYDLLDVPEITPDKSYFRLVWNILYILLFFSFYTALSSKQTTEQFIDVNILFILQFFLQILWTFSFFYLQQLIASAAVILLLDVVAAMLLHTLFFINSWSFFLMLPYFIWLLFATYLNIFISYWN